MGRRRFFFTLGALGSLVLILSFFALLAGIIPWDWDFSSPLRVRAKGVDVAFDQAWHYLLPAAGVFLASLTAAVTGGVWLVRNPAPRNAPF